MWDELNDYHTSSIYPFKNFWTFNGWILQILVGIYWLFGKYKFDS